jgi:hypothetical protein
VSLDARRYRPPKRRLFDRTTDNNDNKKGERVQEIGKHPQKKKKKIEPPKRRGARKKDKLVKNGGWEAGTEHTRDIDTFTYQKSLQPNTCRADNCPFPETPVRTHAHTHTCASSK